MRSPLGFAAAATMLATVVVALAILVLDGDVEFIVHLGLGIGFGLIALAAFDFRIPRWAGWLGAVSAGAFSLLLLLQAVGELVPGEAFHRLVYDVLGQELESLLFDGFLLWCIAVLVGDSRGGTRRFGAVILAIVVGVEVYSWLLLLLGRSINTDAPALKLFTIGVFIWLLLESRKPRGPLPSSIL